jgi:bifunctional UDP-N-acetylglucosamine pyrophosphorylase / glucosamine-1-phosphate N-acetyltransferase
MTSSALSIVILAAGKGTRMKSCKAKVLHEIFFAPMVNHVVNAVLPLKPIRTVVVVGHQGQEVEEALRQLGCEFVVQEQQLGTGHAVLASENAIEEASCTVMILCGDTPLIRTETLSKMYAEHVNRRATLTLMTTILEDPTNYGRIITGVEGQPLGIVEQKDASPEQLQLREINAGIYCVDKSFLFSALQKVDMNNSQNEVYLTDIVKQAVNAGHNVQKFIAPSPTEVLGVNSRVELAGAQHELQLRRNRDLMSQGVTIFNPETVSVSPDTSIGNDTVLEAGVRISGGSIVGHSCTVGQGAILQNCQVGDHAVIGPYVCLSGIHVASDRVIPPFSTTC